FGRAWRRKAPVESLMPLRLARYGVPLAETAPAGLAAAGIEPALLPPAPTPALAPADASASSRTPEPAAALQPQPIERRPAPEDGEHPESPDYAEPQNPWLQARNPQSIEYQGGYDPDAAYREWFAEQQQAELFQEQQQFRSAQQFQEEQMFEEQRRFEEQQRFEEQRRFGQQYEEPSAPAPVPAPEPSPEDTGTFPIPSGPGRTRGLGSGGSTEPTEEDYYLVFKKSIDGSYPTSGQFRGDVEATYRLTLPQREADRMVHRFTNRHTAELQEDHIA
ncbi:hypothetical protein ACFWI3_38445, partial [Streptomyces sp. NPDC127066]